MGWNDHADSPLESSRISFLAVLHRISFDSDGEATVVLKVAATAAHRVALLVPEVHTNLTISIEREENPHAEVHNAK